MALINSKVFGKVAAETKIMKGTDYVQSREGLNIIAEAVMLLQYEEFKNSEEFIIMINGLLPNFDISTFHHNLEEVTTDLYSQDRQKFLEAWEHVKGDCKQIGQLFKKFQSSSESDKKLLLLEHFFNELHPIMRDLELSDRKGDWDLFVSVVRRSLPLFFATGRVHYSRLGPLFYEDCLERQRKFPELNRHFKKGFFVCSLSKKKEVQSDSTKDWKIYNTILLLSLQVE